jgi:inosose dehydratase
MDRLSGAPISWGVCEVPGWGVELPPDRVLREMREVGLHATELGAVGYLPSEPAALRALVTETHGLRMIGGFVPLVVHDPAQAASTIEAARRWAALMSGAGGTVFVSAAVTSWDWEPRRPVDRDGWRHAMDMFATIDEIVGEYGMIQALHPHLGTIIESGDEVRRVLDGSEVGWTLDMGHLMIGGVDPLQFATEAFSRIRHVHLKDVDLTLAGPVRSGRETIMAGVQAGMFTSLGLGDVPVAEIIRSLEASGYDQWYVLEQDAAITGPVPPIGSGPILDVRTSIEFLRTIDADLCEPSGGHCADSGADGRIMKYPIGGENA